MSNNSKIERMKSILSEVKYLERELTSLLIDDFCCLGDIPEKWEIYQMAIHYFEARRERRRSSKRASYSGAKSMKLLSLIEFYTEAQDGDKPEWARKIAQCILEFEGYWLEKIPEDIREEAVRIVIEYLKEEQRRS